MDELSGTWGEQNPSGHHMSISRGVFFPEIKIRVKKETSKGSLKKVCTLQAETSL